jgi:hypothetical protein
MADAATASVRDNPTFWFAVMESAKEKGDFEGAARAKRELERLGVLVTYQKPRGARREAAHAS